MSKAQLVITAVVLEGRSKARSHATTAYPATGSTNSSKRYEAEGAAAFTPRSRRPHTNPHAITDEVEERIIRLQTLAKAGYDAGAATIAEHLRRDPDITEGPRHLHHLAHPGPPRIHHPTTPQTPPLQLETLRSRTTQIQCWQSDVTHWRLTNGTSVEILNIIDDHSRLLIASIARRTITGPDVVDAFTDAFTTWGTLPPSSPTTERSSPPHPDAADGPPGCKSCSANSASTTSTHGPTITHKPAAKSNASTKPSKRLAALPRHSHHRPTRKASSTNSPTTTTPPATVFARPSPHRPPPIEAVNARPKAFPPATKSPRTSASATTKSTPPASSPSATTAARHHIGLLKTSPRHQSPQFVLVNDLDIRDSSTDTPEHSSANSHSS